MKNKFLLIIILGIFLISSISACKQVPVCGNGIIESGEECDDGNNDNGDGCSSICEIEIPEPICGDGVLDSGEECDDGNSDDYDLCSNDCQIQYCDFEFTKTDSVDPVSPGDTLSYHIILTNIGTAKCTGGGVQVKEYYDEYTSFIESVPAPTSGNNLWNFGTIMPGVTKEINIDTEVSESTPCDETLVNEVCVWALEIDEWRCIEETTEIYCETPEPYCGDGVLDAGEECDDGINNGEVCVPEYEDSCQYCDNTCEPVVLEGPFCGDGVKDIPYEECDGLDGVGPNQVCSQECELIDIPYCGDGNVDYGEECDDGNNVNGDGCSSECLIEYCNYCGDGYCLEDETCETCPQDCGECPPEPPECGNGVIEEGEQCDDGNNISGDGCSSICLIEEEDNGGNGGGNGIDGGKINSKLQQFCDVNWECSGWSECVGGATTRKCQDTNHCEIIYNKPIEQAGCKEGIISESLIDKKGFNIPLMFLITTTIILILVLIALSMKK
jgi:uncharacterized repeat protein (TIGR01451 family)